MSPLIKPLIEKSIEKLKRNFNLSQEEILALLTPTDDSFYIKRLEKLTEVAVMGNSLGKEYLNNLVMNCMVVRMNSIGMMLKNFKRVLL